MFNITCEESKNMNVIVKSDQLDPEPSGALARSGHGRVPVSDEGVRPKGADSRTGARLFRRQGKAAFSQA